MRTLQYAIFSFVFQCTAKCVEILRKYVATWLGTLVELTARHQTGRSVIVAFIMAMPERAS
jgi:uncharacterized protein involved in cysteine biosynthesis